MESTLESLARRIDKLEEELKKPKLEDLWVIEFEELEKGFAPQSNFANDAGFDVKIRPTEINTKAIDTVKIYLHYEEEEYIRDLPNIYVDGKNLDIKLLSNDNRKTCLTNLLEQVSNNPVVMLKNKDRVSSIIGCGFKVKLPDLSEIPGWTSVMILTPRSGLGIKCKITLNNTIGIIDQGYRDELKVSLKNTSNDIHIFTKGARVAQVLILPCMKNHKIVDTIDTESERGEKGLGSSGV